MYQKAHGRWFLYLEHISDVEVPKSSCKDTAFKVLISCFVREADLLLLN